MLMKIITSCTKSKSTPEKFEPGMIQRMDGQQERLKSFKITSRFPAVDKEFFPDFSDFFLRYFASFQFLPNLILFTKKYTF